MLKSLICIILNKHDEVLKEVDRLEEEREQFFCVLTDKLKALSERVTQEIVAADSRLTFRGSHLSYVVCYKYEDVLRISIFKLYDRVEMKVNGQRMLLVNGISSKMSTLDEPKFYKLFSDVCVGHIHNHFAAIQQEYLERL